MTDYLGFEDPAEQRAAQGPALIPPERRGPRELKVYHDMQQAAPEIARQMIFTTGVDELTLEPLAVERWEITKDPNTGETRDEGERWRELMKWPTVPTVDEAIAAQANARAACLAQWWDRLKAARRLDEERGWNMAEDGAQPQRVVR